VTRSTRRIVLTLTAAVSAAVLMVFLTHREITRSEPPPQDLAGLGRWMSEHPADWRTAAALSEAALDSGSPNGALLWRAAFDHARLLAPQRTNATTAFVRAGLLHWQQLTPADRRDVLRAAAPLLREPRTFMAMHRPLWELTRDFEYLHRNAPPTEAALSVLRDLAATNGRFADYRELRGEVVANRLRTFRQTRGSLRPPEILTLLPTRLTGADRQLVQEALDELHRRPIDAGNAAAARSRAAELVRFAVAHRLRPLDGIDALLETPEVPAPTRALLAIALGRAAEASNIELTAPNDGGIQWLPYYRERSAFEEAAGNRSLATVYRQRAALAGDSAAWRGLCGRDELCGNASREVDSTRAIEVVAESAQSDEVPPYVEVYVDDVLVEEGPIEDRRVFHLQASTAERTRLEMRLVNPMTRNRIQRRVRLS
jgi:hypothetical protein